MSTVTPRPPATPRPQPRRTTTAGPTKTTTSIDPIRVLRRHAFTLIVAGLIGAVLGTGAYVALDRLMPLYSGQVLFEIRPGISQAQDFSTADSADDEEIVRIAETEGVLLTSRSVLTDAVTNPEVRETEWANQFKDATGTMNVDLAVDALTEEVSSSMVRGSNLFTLKWSTGHKMDVTRVLNSVARAYLAKRQDIEYETYNKNLTLFRTRMNQTSREIEDLEQEIKNYIREKGITTLIDSSDSPLAREVNALNQQINNTIANLNMTQTQYNQTAAKLRGTMEPSPADTLEAEHDPSVSMHIRAVLDLKTNIRTMREKYPPSHPVLKTLEQRLRSTELERDAKIDEIIRRNLEARLKLLGDQIETYKRMLDELEKESEEKSAMLKELTASQSYYESLENRRGHLEAMLESQRQLIQEVELLKLRSDASRIRLAQYAETPREKSFPKWQMIIPLGGILMFGLALGIVFLREFLDQRVKSASDLEVLPHAEVLGSIPELAEDPTDAKEVDLVVRKHPNSVLAEGYRHASMPIRRAIDHQGHQAILFVGGMPGAGTSTAVSNIAATLQATGKRVVVLDANFRRPRLAQAMDVPTDSPGLGDVLCGEVDLDQAMVESSCGVQVLTAGTPANRLFERLGGEQFDHLIAELRTRFDVVLVDAPPAVVAGDAFMLSNKLDATVLVVRANREQRGLVARLINQFTNARSELLGVLLNRPRGTAGGYFKKNYEAMAEYAAKSTG